MAIEAFLLRMLCRARRAGASFGDSVTLGRQRVSMLPGELDEAMAELGPGTGRARPGGKAVFAEDVLPCLLGVERLVSIDCSGYEGASVVHDLNQPVPAEHVGSYDAVIDGGTIEHVFNVPMALGNCMRMLRVGGRFYALTPANNHCGHGFYQFSPELFYRVFGADNGFEVEHVLAIEHPFPGIELSSRRTVYEVRDPARVGDRVSLVNTRPVYLFVQAIKRAAVEPFASVPQQSDYVAAWAGATPPRRLPEEVARRLADVWRVLPYRLRRVLTGYHQRLLRDTFRNSASYRRWRP
jgi:SAM-dependent methyltransferase